MSHDMPTGSNSISAYPSPHHMEKFTQCELFHLSLILINQDLNSYGQWTIVNAMDDNLEYMSSDWGRSDM